MARFVLLVSVVLTNFVAFNFVSLNSVQAQEPYWPSIAEASKDAELALKGFVLPEKMNGTLWAAEPMLANPVAFTVTNDGRVIVCETFRQEVGVEDNRGHANWLENDLQLESVEERAAMFKKYMGDDLQKWAKEHDRLRMLQDTNGDGTLDRETVLADGFNNIVDGTGAGVLEHDGHIYYTCIPNLYRFGDSNRDGIADQQEELHHGYGVRVAFRGHDMHGLVMGPDGRIYFSIGDRGFNVITKEGTRLKRVDTGAVFRCDTDGSHLEVFAYGLRNPQELAFDDHGNLFTGDNNSDSGDQARWVYVVQDGDTGWRMYYQYLDDRGPWNRERIWYPYRADEETTSVQPAATLPPIANLGDGPSGLTFYPGVGLPERYAGHFFMADFRGTAGNSGIRSFTNTPRGATFELTDSHQFIWSILATDVDFAPDTSIVVSDWVNGWNGEGKGRLYRFTHEIDSAKAIAAGSASLLGGGISRSSVEDLVKLLQHADRRVRQQAQFELVRRGEFLEMMTVVRTVRNETSVMHGVWGCWQFGLESAEQAATVNALMLEVLSDRSRGYSSELQTQALKVITDLVARHGFAAVPGDLRSNITAAVKDLTTRDDLRLAGFAAVTLGTLAGPAESKTLLTLLNRNNDLDPVVRHQAVMGLSKLAERHPGMLENLADNGGTPGRLGVLLAMRRHQNPAVARFLKDADSALIAEAARAINDEPIESAQPALADLLGTPGLDDNTVRRCMNAAYRRGLADDAAHIARAAADAGVSPAVRFVAANLLATWNHPQNTDTVTGRWRPLPMREVQGLEQAVSPHLPGMLAGATALREKAVEVATELGIKDIIPSLNAILQDTNMEDALRVAAFRAVVKLSPEVAGVVATGLNDPSEAVRLAAVEVATLREPYNAVPRLKELLQSDSLRSQQTALRLIAPIQTDETESILLDSFARLKRHEFRLGAVLDLINAAELRGTPKLKAAIEDFRGRQREQGTVLALWDECLEGGNAERGRELFFGRSAASCRRCHKVAGSGGDVGPDLSKIGKEKDRNYLLEAIVEPSAKIAKGFETVIVVTMEGKIHSGILKRDDDSVVQLMTPTGALISVAKDDIDERANGQSGMPQDISKNLTRAEIRDIVEYLTTLQSEPVTAEHGKHE